MEWNDRNGKGGRKEERKIQQNSRKEGQRERSKGKERKKEGGRMKRRNWGRWRKPGVQSAWLNG